MRNLKSITVGGMAAAVALAVGFTGTAIAPAHAAGTVTPFYEGGSTLAEKVYRDLESCYGSNSTLAPQLDNGGTGGSGVATGTASFTALCTTGYTPVNTLFEGLYVGVGSGAGKKAWASHNAANLVSSNGPDSNPFPFSGDFNGGSPSDAYYGTYAGGVWTPGATGIGPDFPGFQFAGSDAQLVPSDITAYYTTNAIEPAEGPAVQFPSMIAGIAVPFNANDGSGSPLALNGVTPPTKYNFGDAAYLNLTTNEVCGIYTGTVTTWNDATLTATNRGTVLGTGQITPTYRNDPNGSGTQLIFSTGLLNQCGSSLFPVAGISNSVPEQWLIDAGALDKNNATVTASSDAGPPYTGSSKFYLKVAGAHHLPANFDQNGENGSGGIETFVENTNGAVGYVGTANVWTSSASGSAPHAAALAVLASEKGSKPKLVFVQPTTTAVSAIMSKALPPKDTAGTCTTATGWAAGTSPDGVCSHNAVNWGVVNPAPTSTNTYPIGGFTFIEAYSCYASQTRLNDLVGKKGTGVPANGFFYWYFTDLASSKVPYKDITQNGFAPLPAAWISGVENLLWKDAVTKLRIGGSTATFADGTTCGAAGTGA